MIKNKLLLRQIKKAGIGDNSVPSRESFESLLKLVEQSYDDNVKSRRLIEHSLDVSSEEIREVIDELERVHKDAEKKDKMMFQQSRLAQMGEMINMIAHQWRQPLNLITNTTASIQFDLHFSKLDEKVLMQHTENIAQYANYLSDTIDDFRNFFMLNKEMEITNFHKEIKGTLNIIGESLLYNKIEVIKEENSRKEFATYPSELKHAIINIIKNAEDVLVEKKVKNPTIKIKTYELKDRVVLQISDNGGGIDDNIIDKIFDPYFSTKTKKSGTGLGLYMSKIIIEDHCHGLLNVSNNDNGSVFEIMLSL